MLLVWSLPPQTPRVELPGPPRRVSIPTTLVLDMYTAASRDSTRISRLRRSPSFSKSGLHHQRPPLVPVRDLYHPDFVPTRSCKTNSRGRRSSAPLTKTGAFLAACRGDMCFSAAHPYTTIRLGVPSASALAYRGAVFLSVIFAHAAPHDSHKVRACFARTVCMLTGVHRAKILRRRVPLPERFGTRSRRSRSTTAQPPRVCAEGITRASAYLHCPSASSPLRPTPP